MTESKKWGYRRRGVSWSLWAEARTKCAMGAGGAGVTPSEGDGHMHYDFSPPSPASASHWLSPEASQVHRSLGNATCVGQVSEIQSRVREGQGMDLPKTTQKPLAQKQ